MTPESARLLRSFRDSFIDKRSKEKQILKGIVIDYLIFSHIAEQSALMYRKFCLSILICVGRKLLLGLQKLLICQLRLLCGEETVSE